MDETLFFRIVQAVFAQSPAGSDSFLGKAYYTNDGVVGVGGENSGTVGFGIASGLTVTPTLLSGVSDLNRLMPFGNYWLAPGADEDHYSLVCGLKFYYSVSHHESVVATVGAAVQNHKTIVEAARQNNLGGVDHQEYWRSDAAPGANSIVLIGHLG